MTLKEKLDYHYKSYNKKDFPPDPLQFLYNFSSNKDIETAGLISSVFAYGNVRSIITTLDKIFKITGKNPYSFIINANDDDLSDFRKIKHRFYSGEDVYSLFKGLQNFYSESGMVKNFFYKNYIDQDKDLRYPMNKFSHYMYKKILSIRKLNTPGIKFMFPNPESGSACKRMNLFLRWMVRKDKIDFGIWNKIPSSKLIIPVDTHIARICTRLELTNLKNVSWKMAEQITDKLRKYSPDDPVKYDFAICHIGMDKKQF